MLCKRCLSVAVVSNQSDSMMPRICFPCCSPGGASQQCPRRAIDPESPAANSYSSGAHRQFCFNKHICKHTTYVLIAAANLDAHFPRHRHIASGSALLLLGYMNHLPNPRHVTDICEAYTCRTGLLVENTWSNHSLTEQSGKDHVPYTQQRISFLPLWCLAS
ncbi:hypothetical protein F4825DRAFT_300203 [Nemania diffusa]|nr:hypothetical protein F4825DRAFT_300203 [Nemania diffusa]